MEVEIEQLLAESPADPRRHLDQDRVRRYAEVLDQLPPVVVFELGDHTLLADGYHRVAAAQLAGRRTVQADLFGFSMGGMIAQVIAQQQPQLVRKMILAGTGPAGGEGIDKVTRITYLDTARGLLTRQDPKQLLFFTRTPNGRRAGKEFLARLEEGTNDRHKAISVRSLSRPAQGHPPMESADACGPREIHQPVLVMNGEGDKMVPINTHAARTPNLSSAGWNG